MNQPATPLRTYLLVYLALLALTITTVAVSKVELGELNFVVAFTIAVIKGVLVVWFFMHVNHATSLTRVFVVGAFFWMVILIALTLSDYLSRGWVVQGTWWR